MCIQGKGNAKAVGCADTNVDNGKQELPKKVLDKSPNLCYNKYVPRGTKNQIMKEVVTMANKKTVVQMYEEILAIPTLTAEQKAFIEKRIEITQKKNANRGENAKPTKTQVENEGIKDTIVSVLTATPTTITDLIKSSADLAGYTNQKISALLTQLLKAEAVVRTEVKGKAYYALPSTDIAE